MRTCKHYANSIVYTFIHVVMYSNMKCGHEIMHNWIHVYIVIMKTMCNYVHEYIKTPVLLSISFIFFTETYQITVIWYVSKYKSYHRLLYINPASCFLWLCRASPFLCIFSLLLCSSALRANGSLAFVGVVALLFSPNSGSYPFLFQGHLDSLAWCQCLSSELTSSRFLVGILARWCSGSGWTCLNVHGVDIVYASMAVIPVIIAIMIAIPSLKRVLLIFPLQI